jgi:hypothetical protein
MCRIEDGFSTRNRTKIITNGTLIHGVILISFQDRSLLTLKRMLKQVQHDKFKFESVIPAKAGIQWFVKNRFPLLPTAGRFVGMTDLFFS